MPMTGIRSIKRSMVVFPDGVPYHQRSAKIPPTMTAIPTNN
jgi:hypothetical protein